MFSLRCQAEERAAWTALGLDEEAWPPGSGLFDGFGDDARSKSWKDLTEEEQAAAQALGWNERSFTDDAYTRYIDLAYCDLSEEQRDAVDTLEIDEGDWNDMTAELENREGWVADGSVGLMDPDADGDSGSGGGSDGDGDGGEILARSRSAKLSARAGFSIIDKS